FFFQAEDGIRDFHVTGVQTCALPILLREQPVQAATRQQLRALLANRPSGGIVFATIQKFMPGEDEDSFPVLSQRSNIVVIADEAHRTQYGFKATLKARQRDLETNKASALAGQALTAITSIATSDAGSSALPAHFEPPHYHAGLQATWQAGYAQHLRDALPNATF